MNGKSSEYQCVYVDREDLVMKIKKLCYSLLVKRDERESSLSPRSYKLVRARSTFFFPCAVLLFVIYKMGLPPDGDGLTTLFVLSEW